MISGGSCTVVVPFGSVDSVLGTANSADTTVYATFADNSPNAGEATVTLQTSHSGTPTIYFSIWGH